jgi:hypothetical protein
MTPGEMLRFDWELVHGRPISAVVGRRTDAGLWEAMALVAGSRAVLLTVNDDTDEVVVSLEDARETAGWKEFDALSYLVGRPFGWCWCGTNWRGYRDAFIVAFGDVVPDALDPRVMFLGEGSALTCLELKALRS